MTSRNTSELEANAAAYSPARSDPSVRSSIKNKFFNSKSNLIPGCVILIGPTDGRGRF